MPQKERENEPRDETVRNAKEGGRFGTAPPGEPHLSPELPPPETEGEAPPLPDAPVPGALPENRGEDPADTTDKVQRKPGRHPGGW